MSRKRCLISVGFVWLLLAGSVFGNYKIYNVRDYGAEGDGKILCTKAIQEAIDQCADDGGGTVYLPPGTYLSGTIFLKSHVTLRLDLGSILLGSKDPNDYPVKSSGSGTDKLVSGSLIAGQGLNHIAIVGRGTIDGQGSAFRWKDGGRPKCIHLAGCSDVLIEGVRMQSAGSWMQHYRGCDRLTIRDIAVFNHVTYNNDGLNIDSCKDVCIYGCMVDSDDDAVVLKSLSLRPCENVTISNCVISSHCNSIKMGTESGGGFQNITISNCTILSPRYSQSIYGKQRGLAGIALEIVDGGILEGVAISNITIKGVTVPIFMRMGDRGRQYEKDKPKPAVGSFRNVVVSNILATDCSNVGCSITGLPGHLIENVSLNNINLGFEGGGTVEDAVRQVPEKPQSYPESTMFGVLPAYGLYCRHVKGLKLNNVQLQLAADDRRHALVFEDVQDALVDGLDAAFYPGASSTIRLTDVKGALIRGSRPKVGTDIFLELQGAQSDNVVLMGNDLSGVNKVVQISPDVPKGAFFELANHTAQK